MSVAAANAREQEENGHESTCDLSVRLSRISCSTDPGFPREIRPAIFDVAKRRPTPAPGRISTADASGSHLNEVEHLSDGTEPLAELIVQTPAVGRQFSPGCRSAEESAQPQPPPMSEVVSAANVSPRLDSEALDPVAPRTGAGLRLLSAAELCASAPEGTEWIAAYTAPGAITDITGLPKVAGKTTLAMDMARAVTSGAAFLGQPTKQGAVVYLTEERNETLREALRRAGLESEEKLHLFQSHKRHGIPWGEVVDSCIEQGKTLGALVLVVDTFLVWSGLEEEQENDAGATFAVMKPLLRAAGEGLAVWVLRHDRKAGGGVVSSSRGSNAISGAADLVLQITPVGDNRPNVRKIKYRGRFDGPPPEQLIARTPSGYRLVASNETHRERLLEVAPATKEEAMTPDQFMEQTGIGRDTTRNLLRTLGSEGVLVELGKGSRGGGYRYYAP